MTAVEKLIEQTAYEFRQHIRAKAGLDVDWKKASKSMQEFYRDIAFNYLVTNGEIEIEE